MDLNNAFMKSLNEDIFDKVLFLGPDKKAKGGMASVLESYSQYFSPFHYLPTNSRKNSLVGLWNAMVSALSLPLHRLRGRKIVHIHYATGKSWVRKVFLMYLTKVLGFKIVMHCHGAEMKQFSGKVGYSKIGKVLGHADANIVLSESWKEFFQKKLNCRDIYIINNIVGYPALETDHNTGLFIEFLFLGKIDYRKGLYDILKACKILKDKEYKFRLVVGGNGEIDKFKKAVSENGLEDFIDFRGWMTGEEKEHALSHCDVLMLPSFNEGLPIAILEAMTYGKAVISTPVGGIPEIIRHEDNGLLVTPGNVEEIASAMERYIKDSGLAHGHGKKSLKIIENFLPETVGAQLEQIYRGLLKSSR